MSTENGTFNNNDRQRNFNQIRGVITEFLPGEKFCSITLELGHEKKRFVNLVVKKTDNQGVITYDQIMSKFKLGDKVSVKFYVTSKKNSQGHWSSMITALDAEACK